MNYQKQSGYALLIALLIVATASVIGANLWFNNQLSIAKAINIQHATQARHYARGMVLWAKDILYEEEQRKPGVDTNSDVWQQPIDGITVSNAVIGGQLSDMSGCFNLNNLWAEYPGGRKQYNYLTRLLSLLEIDVGISDKILDWMDADQQLRPQGAEDFVYLSKRKPYTTLSGPFRHISELQLIDGVDDRIYQRLVQYLCITPLRKSYSNNTWEMTKMNINMLPPVMIKALHSGISKQLALSIYHEGQAQFQSLNDFFNYPPVKRIRLKEQAPELWDLIDVNSEYLQAEIQVNMEGNLYRYFVLLNKPIGGFIHVVQWSGMSFLLNQ